MESIPRPVLETLILPLAFDSVREAAALALTCRAFARAMRSFQTWRPWLVRQQRVTREVLKDCTAFAGRSDDEWIDVLARTLPDLRTLVQCFSCFVTPEYFPVLPAERIVHESWTEGGFIGTTWSCVTRGLCRGRSAICPALSWDRGICYRIDSRSRTLQMPGRLEIEREENVVRIPGGWTVAIDLDAIAPVGVNCGTVDGGENENLLLLPRWQHFPEHVLRMGTGQSLCCKTGQLCQLETVREATESDRLVHFSDGCSYYLFGGEKEEAGGVLWKQGDGEAELLKTMF
jgi:hypothetical protein